MERLPVIDLSPLVTAAPQARNAALKAVADAIGAAARGPGFFYVTGHGIPDDLIEAVFGRSADFFALPREDKAPLSIEKSPHNRGYVGLLGEKLDTAKPADLKEAFNIGLDLAPDDPRIERGEPFRGVNVWPQDPAFRETMLAYYEAAWNVGRLLHRAIAIDLGMPEDFFEDKLDQPMAVLRLLHYPPHPAGAEEGQLGAGEHTDYGNITLLMTDDVGGLEVRRRDGTWLKAPPMPGNFVCNIGDCLMRWTNDVYVSTPHRVLNSGGRERYSVAFFLDPNPDADVACLPTCLEAGSTAKYPPVTGADYLKQRLDATYDFRKKVTT
ncbi:2-oxoglutarate-dependent ethylene/succinate-forming enzyme [Hartmannibacter diazotrophicus]|uniref:2-oxoglutarate-dependent ethylene/succinate-forming enzyme n=1 Tax=Hartmannibacter diazotrophicus TaxID=1482074 RepID=A0A2C9D9L3_9HYPH|nr:2-oxoglutarate and iron-dependent oxygenase domain-containing protein [Hartmannibacter diazotrophicus]SON56923.1 2-oxoglutarate-dependent ethylene/succinate-forming enzyme [Hartmannibacter diazotrophicus]